ncbi:aldehyde reductase, putative [Plasmodium malariae]|uniref:Aldehyde reductase, putative n=1 Tax=Plasmodium malariae TaxID=5858 RepID=A0A1C3KZ35_PLAMA|nr:aldehyde reductase, putative [Plasmodium malariae]
MKKRSVLKCIHILFFLLLYFFIEINCKSYNLFSTKSITPFIERRVNRTVLKKAKLNYGSNEELLVCLSNKKRKNEKKNKKIAVQYFIKECSNYNFRKLRRKIKKFLIHINIYGKDYNDKFNFISKDEKGNSAYDSDKNKNFIGKNEKMNADNMKGKIKKEDEVTYKYVEEMELKKINIRGVDIEYRIYNLEEGIYIVDNNNYEKIKKLWNKDELKKAKENFQERFDIKKQGIKEDDWIMLPFDYEENKNIKLVKADFDNPLYDYILTYYDKERNYYFEYKRRNYYKMLRNTIHETPPYKSELEEDKRFYGKEIIIPKKKLDNEIFRQPMLSDVLTGGYSKEPIGLESWRYVQYPYGNLIEHQKYCQPYCVKKNGKDKPDMRYHYLGNSNLAVSEICLGTMNFGNYVNEKLAHELFDYAYEEFQVNFFDTAEIYPLPVSENYFGLSEQILGNWVNSKGKANRHKFVIATKICGRTDKIPWAKKYKRKKRDEQKKQEEGEAAEGEEEGRSSLLSRNRKFMEDTNSSDVPCNPFDKLNTLKKKEELYLKKDYETLEQIDESEKRSKEKEDNFITLSKDSIIASVDNCLKRLKTNYIDLLQLHWPDRYYPNHSSGDFSDVLYDYNKYYDNFVPFIEQLHAIDELKRKGKIREWGLSNETPFGLLKFYELCKQLHISLPVSVQLEYNLLCRNDVEKGFPEICRPQNTNISILAYSPLCAGILTGKYLEYTDYTTKGRMQKFPSYMKRLRGSIATYIIRELYYLSQKYYFPNLTVAALKWVYTRSFVTSTVIGVSDFLQLRENLYSLTDQVLFTDKLEREINALHWKFRDPIRIIQ